MRFAAPCLLARVVLAPLFVALQAVPALAQSASGGPQTTRGSFLVGLNGGVGWADATSDDPQDTLETELGGTGHVRAGWRVTRHVVLGGDLSFWTRKRDLLGDDVWFTMYNASAVVSVYPAPSGTGFFVTAGGGVAYADADVKRRSSRVTVELGSGPGLIVGAGYEHGRGRLAFTPAVTWWHGWIGDRRSRGGAVASNWRQSVVGVSVGVTFR